MNAIYSFQLTASLISLGVLTLTMAMDTSTQSADPLRGKRIAILATDGFEQVELTGPRKALDAAGAKTVVIAPHDGKIKAWKDKDWGESIAVDATLDQASVDQFDGLLLPGGVLNPDKLRTDRKAVHFVKAFFDAKKPVAAICHGPIMLIEAGVLQNRTLTSWPSVQTDIRNAGGTWVDAEVIVDRNLVTSRKPADIQAFNREIIKEFSGPSAKVSK